MIQYERDQDDEPMESNDDHGGAGRQDEYGQPVASPSQKQLSFAQQKAELKRKIMAQPPKKVKAKKELKDTVYNPEGKSELFSSNNINLTIFQNITMRRLRKSRIVSSAKSKASYTLMTSTSCPLWVLAPLAACALSNTDVMGRRRIHLR